MYQDLEKILYTRADLQQRVNELGAQITKDYEGKFPLLICLLKGSCIFFADLVRAIETHVELDFIMVSSYGSSVNSSGNIVIKKDLSCDISDRDVIIVEDIIDSGLTISYLKKYLQTRKPRSISVCTLLNQQKRRKADLTPEYIGFELNSEFVVGYGLDFAERFRNLPEIGILKHELYEDKE
ncbi:MAG: hypoxanthine phosphoribosyltransferase [Clostridia bacterium]|nr:hypoxanthine phosphoribosyltransferase [Clostridia bacterium]